MQFTAIDVETANEDLASICQVGLANFRDGQLAETWSSLVNPEDYFSPVNISIHGIDQRQVSSAPTWRQLYPSIFSQLHGNIAVCHTPFDRIAVTKACQISSLDECQCTWLDSARVTRRAWPQFAHSGYGLANIAEYLDIQYRAHDALEDARCAGIVVLRAIEATGVSLDQWLIRATQPIGSVLESSSIRREGHDGCELSGEVIAFTGALTMPRRNAADVAAGLGAQVDDGVTRHTTILVVGDQDIRHLGGHEKSQKHRKAELLISRGHPIRILGETDFLRLASHNDSNRSPKV